MAAHRRSRGFTLIELLLAVGISLLIAVGVFRAYQATDRDTKIQETAALLDTLFDQAIYVTAQSNEFSVPQMGGAPATLSTSVLLDSVGANSEASQLLYPIGSTVTGGQIIHPFDANVQISTESSLPGANDLVAIRLQGIPRAACLNLLQRMSTYGLYDMWVETGGANKLVALDPPANTDAPGRNNVVIAKANTLCNRGSRSTLTFRLLKHVDISSMRRTSFGDVLSPAEIARIQPLFDRQQAAMEARENAQMAL